MKFFKYISKWQLLALLSVAVLTGCTAGPKKNANYEDGPKWKEYKAEDKPKWGSYKLNTEAETYPSYRWGDWFEKEFGRLRLSSGPQVDKWVNYFTGRGRRHMKRYLERSTRYLPTMKRILHDRGLPEELAYLQFVESGFNPKAYSSAAAVGYWQFIRGTGKSYNLRIDGYIDERRDPILSTHAAASYFHALYSLFGDWYLAMAAYNWGEGRVKRAVMKYKTRNYFELARRKKMPRETAEYVPKLMAAIHIAKNPKKYGFTDLNYMPPLAYDKVEIQSPISLHKWAGQMGLPYKDIQYLNPKYRTDYVPVGRDKVTLRVPEGFQKAGLTAVAKSKAKRPKHYARGTWSYKIRRGDTLSTIARRNGTSVRRLMALNNLGRRSLLRIGKRIRIPHRSYARSSSKRRVASRASGTVHYVRPGETLGSIARRHKISITSLRRANNMGRSSFIRAGQSLRLPASKASTKRGFHRVRRGESLSSIARRYGLSLADILKINKLSARSVIYPGQRLKLRY